jgi:hypothetical protein
MSGGVKKKLTGRKSGNMKPDTGGGPVDDRWKIRIDKKDKSGV